MADSRILLAALALAATSLAPAVALSGAPKPAAEGLELAAPRTLAPRAVANHRWYREKFADYPAERRVLIPGVF